MINQRGFGIIAAVFLILILSMLTILSASLFSSDIEIVLDSLRSAQALFMCEGAMNYCIKHELINDTDWSDNTDTIDKPFGKGIVSIFYDPNTKASEANVRIVATVDNITRKVDQSFKRGWPGKYKDFPYSLFTSDKLTIQSSPGFSIEAPYEINNPDTQTINCNFGYYAGIADTIKTSGWYEGMNFNSTYTGIIYVNGNVKFDKCYNLTINGTIVATGDILISECKGFIVNPSSNYPALVAGSNIKIEKVSENIDVRGMLFAENDVFILDTRTFFMSGILYARKHVNIIKTDDFMINGSIISQLEIKFDTCGGTGPIINWGNKILNEPPGFSWNESFIIGIWEEAY